MLKRGHHVQTIILGIHVSCRGCIHHIITQIMKRCHSKNAAQVQRHQIDIDNEYPSSTEPRKKNNQHKKINMKKKHTLPETNSLPLKMHLQKEKESSKQPFSGAFAVNFQKG